NLQMSSTRPYDAVIFDMGGVLMPAPMFFWKKLEKKIGLKEGSLVETIIGDEDANRAFKLLECGKLNAEDFEPLFISIYNKRHGTQLGTLKVFSGEKLSMDQILWPEMITAVKILKSEGLKVGLITNNAFLDRSHARETIPKDFNKLFDVVVESCREGVRKPDAPIYKKAIDRLRVPANRCIFLDDLGVNCKTASGMGMKAIKVTDRSSALRQLESIFSIRLDVPPETRPLITREKLDETALRQFLAKELGVVAGKPEDFVLRRFGHGQSNPTYYVRCGTKELVLRKKPVGKVLPKAHQVDREFRVMKALGNTPVPVPKSHLYNESLLDSPFYVMDYVRGRLYLDPSIPGVTVEQRKCLWKEAIQNLAHIHTLNVDKVGLGDYGRKDGYMERNFKRWTTAYEMSATEEIEEVNKLHDYLEKHLPRNGEVTLVHGDYRIDNLLFHGKENKVVAVLDWELSTIGDPLADLATFLFAHYNSMWHKDFPCIGHLSADEQRKLGIPTVEEVLQEYERCIGRKIPRQLWNTYVAYTFYRNACIIQGVYMRSKLQQAASTNAHLLAPLPRYFAKIGLEMVKEKKSEEDAGLMILPSNLSEKARKLYKIVHDIVMNDVIPLEPELIEFYSDPTNWKDHPKLNALKEKARSLGAWNMFIARFIDPANKYGAGLTNVEYAHICELMGRSVFAAEIFNCQAPDTGNMEVLIKYGTEEQKEKWLRPMLDGKIKSCFAMTEPDVASSDASNIQGSIVRVGDEYVINARKWFASGAAHPHCEIAIFMGRVATEGKVSRLTQQSMILVPMKTPGVKIIRNLPVFGVYDPPAGHCEILFTNVRVPVESMILGEGRGFEVAQGRLGPGRIHHAMRLIGHCERAIDIMKDRVKSRTAFGQKLEKFDSIRKDIAKSRIEVEQARLLVLRAAHSIDTVGSKGAYKEIGMIKVAAPNVALSVLDRAIQMQGARGVTMDTPLAMMWVWARTLRIADGPDEVHLETIAKMELKSRL
ncbi:acds-10, partial [Pristionchus pacificus]